MAGRPREFDEQQALEQAMQVFWSRGYESAGMRELLAAMGLSRQSCYNTFGDKRELFLRAIDHYGDTIVQDVCNRLGRPGSPIKQLTEFVRAQAQRACCKSGQYGCLLMNSVVEFGNTDPQVARRIRKLLDRIEQAITKSLRQAQLKGELQPSASPELLAAYLTHVIFGFASRGKIKMSKEKADGIVQLVIQTLEAA